MSDLSSGRVDDDEILLRLLVAPTHMQKKRVEPRASCLTDAETSGLSLLRDAQATDEQIRFLAEELVERARHSHGSKAGVFGVLKLLSGAVRGYIADLEQESSYCIYDTAEPKRKCHAEAFQKVFRAPDEIQSARRTGLFNVVKSQFVPVADFRGGILLDLAPSSV